MKACLLVACCMLLANSGAAFAGASVSGNVAVSSDYLFRGISQTWGRPALQGGVDVGNGRWHIGAWASNVSRDSYPGGGAELDWFGDVGLFRRGDWSARFGLYAYVYPDANLDQARPALPQRKLGTLEANLALTWKIWTLKYSRALTDYFGADVEQGYSGGTRGTQYLQLDASIPLGARWSLAPHLGYTDYRRGLQTALANGARDPSYADFGLALKYALDAKFAVSLGIAHTTNGRFYGRVASFLDPARVNDLGGTRAAFALSAAF
jgi:uncharacterized protein (TIGR02001 family)